MQNFTIDYSTKNSSFIKMYKVLKEMGIENNKFFLKLYDPSLMGVDPHDEKKLTKEQKARIIVEISKNKWYYFREVVRIPVPGGKIPYELNRGNLALSWCKSMNLNLILLLPRQNGKTIGAITDDTWTYHFGTENTDILYGNKELKDSTLNLKRFKDIIDSLPQFIKDAILNLGFDTDNQTEKKSHLRNNSLKALSSPRDAASADKLGRGTTTPLIYWDEFAFLKYNDIVYGSASPALSRAQEMAIRMGKPYGKTITTTPSNLDIPEGKFCKSMIDNACQFDESMYDWNIEKVQKFIQTNSTNDFIHIQFSYKQLGKSEEWFDKQRRSLNNDLFLIKREILLEWTLANDTSPFTEDQLEMMASKVEEPEGKLFIKEYYKFNFYSSLNPETPYLIGVDVAGGLSRDDSAIFIADPFTLKVVGEFKNNTIDTADLTLVLLELVSKYMPKSVLAIERNSYGKAIIDNLLRSPIANNIYYELRETPAEKKINEGRVVKSKVKTRLYGINTDKNSREKMINEILRGIVNDEPHVVNSAWLYDNIKNLERKIGNRIEHRDGEKDDCLFAYLVLRYMYAYGTNLSKFSIFKNKDTENIEIVKNRNLTNINLITMLNRKEDPYQGSFSENVVKTQNELLNQNSNFNTSAFRILEILRMNNQENNNDNF
jgi:hypothetical protein